MNDRQRKIFVFRCLFCHADRGPDDAARRYPDAAQYFSQRQQNQRRHEVIHRFLCALNHSDNELEQVEKIEHFLNRTTVKNLEQLIVRLTEK